MIEVLRTLEIPTGSLIDHASTSRALTIRNRKQSHQTRFGMSGKDVISSSMPEGHPF